MAKRQDGTGAALPMPQMIRLKEIIDTLRSPGGCPWDLEQTPESLRPFLLEEAHEVAEAISEGDSQHLCEELGDLLMNILLQARIGEEKEQFTLEDVARRISDKLIRRHPHVFGEGEAETPDQVRQAWDRIKDEEKGIEGSASPTIRPLPASLPALLQADRIGKMAAEVGFDWPDEGGALAKVSEELGELKEAIEAADPREIRHEVGDILFAMSSVARKLGIDGEEALQESLARFRNRFHHVDQQLTHHGVEEAQLHQLEEWYQQGKGSEKENDDA